MARLHPEPTLLLEPGPGNTRNSEGDFIRLLDGRWLFVYSKFSAGTGDDHDLAELASRISDDDGRTWSAEDVPAVPNAAGLNIMSVTLLRLPLSGEIALFYLHKESLSDCRPVMRRSTDEGQTWSAPSAIISDEIAYYIVNNGRVVVLSSGRIVVPAAHHKGPDGAFTMVSSAMCYLSDDQGQTWRRSRSVLLLPVPDTTVGLQEPGVVELSDGRLMLWARTDQGTQWFSFSSDGGDTWSPPKPSDLRSPVAPATIKRIPSTGDLVAIWNDNFVPNYPWTFGDRTPLAVAISSDDGETWTRRHVLEDDPKGWYCYTALAFTGEGADEQMLLAYSAGYGIQDGIKTLKLSRLPVAALYG